MKAYYLTFYMIIILKYSPDNKNMSAPPQSVALLQKQNQTAPNIEDALLFENEEIIQNLNKKIGRRLNIGYYCDVPSNSRNLIFPPRKYSPPRALPPKTHRVFKKPKKTGRAPTIQSNQKCETANRILKEYLCSFNLGQYQEIIHYSGMNLNRRKWTNRLSTRSRAR